MIKKLAENLSAKTIKLGELNKSTQKNRSSI